MLIQEGEKDKGKIRGKGYGLRGKGKKCGIYLRMDA